VLEVIANVKGQESKIKVKFGEENKILLAHDLPSIS
jgi:hypothetical protein